MRGRVAAKQRGGYYPSATLWRTMVLQTAYFSGLQQGVARLFALWTYGLGWVAVTS
jgi:hypothetical protein